MRNVPRWDGRRWDPAESPPPSSPAIPFQVVSRQWRRFLCDSSQHHPRARIARVPSMHQFDVPSNLSGHSLILTLWVNGLLWFSVHRVFSFLCCFIPHLCGIGRWVCPSICWMVFELISWLISASISKLIFLYEIMEVSGVWLCESCGLWDEGTLLDYRKWAGEILVDLALYIMVCSWGIWLLLGQK